MANIIYISDAEPKGSGYQNIGTSLCVGLSMIGHEIYYIGLNYSGEENNFPFHLLPCKTFKEVEAIYHNLCRVWNPDLVVVAFDIPIQIQMFPRLKKNKDLPYIGIMPLESDPLCFAWAISLMPLDKAFFISQFGTNEAKKTGLTNVEHLQIGIDSESWRIPTKEERKAIRGSVLGIEDDGTFVILTVADNQERKNLSAAMQMIAKFKNEVSRNFKYVLVTREHSGAGWELRDLSNRLGISLETMIFDRGIPFKLLWSIYAASDCFLLPSKGEGLGLPILEAMSCGVPVVGTKTGAITELLSEDRGYLIEPAYVTIDPYGNSNRYYADIDNGSYKLEEVYKGINLYNAVKASRDYVLENRNWGMAVGKVDETIKGLLNGKEKEPTKLIEEPVQFTEWESEPEE